MPETHIEKELGSSSGVMQLILIDPNRMTCGVSYGQEYLATVTMADGSPFSWDDGVLQQFREVGHRLIC